MKDEINPYSIGRLWIGLAAMLATLCTAWQMIVANRQPGSTLLSYFVAAIVLALSIAGSVLLYRGPSRILWAASMILTSLWALWLVAALGFDFLYQVEGY
jgi:hypothetical protein